MTDQDLIELLRSEYAETVADEAADRIEELLKKVAEFEHLDDNIGMKG